MNDEKVCDELLDELESAGRKFEGFDFYEVWKFLDKSIKILRPFIKKKHDRKTAKKVLMSAPKFSEEERAQLIGAVRMIPEIVRHCTKGIGQPVNSGMISKFSHEEREAIREKVESLKKGGMRPTEAVKAVAELRESSESEIWNILNENTTDPQYWVGEVRRNILRASATPKR